MSGKYKKAFRPVAARVSEAVGKLDGGLEKHNANEGNPGFRCTQWIEDEYGNPTVKVEWFMGSNPDVGIGRKYEGRVAAARRAKLREIMFGLDDSNYNVVWGWEPDTGDPDTNFIVVISPESAELDAQGMGPDEDDEPNEEPQENVDEEPRIQRLASVIEIDLKQAQEAVLAIQRSFNVGRDEQARRLEHQLMKAVLVSIVCGSEDAVDLAAVALESQHLPFAR